MLGGSTTSDPVISAAIAIQTTLSRWVIGLGADGLLALSATVLLVVAVLLLRRRRAATHDGAVDLDQPSATAQRRPVNAGDLLVLGAGSGAVRLGPTAAQRGVVPGQRAVMKIGLHLSDLTYPNAPAGSQTTSPGSSSRPRRRGSPG